MLRGVERRRGRVRGSGLERQTETLVFKTRERFEMEKKKPTTKKIWFHFSLAAPAV